MSDSDASRDTAHAASRGGGILPDPDARHGQDGPAEPGPDTPPNAQARRDRAPAMPVGRLSHELGIFWRNAALFVAGVAMISAGYIMYAASGQFNAVSMMLSIVGALSLLCGAVLGGLSIVSMSIASHRQSKAPEPPAQSS